MTATRALFGAPAARRALAACGTGVVELTSGAAAYLTLGREWVLVAEPLVPFGPLSLVVESVQVNPGRTVSVSGSELVIGEQTIALERMRERRPLSLDTGCEARPEAVVAAARTALRLLPAAPESLRDGIAALADGRGCDAAGMLAGRGEGLTPAGDDVLAGYAAWTRRDGLLSERAAGRSSPLGLAYLRCAERGELPDAGARMLAAIRGGSVAAVRDALPGVRAWGASSGIALTWGICAGAKASAGRGSERTDIRHLIYR